MRRPILLTALLTLAAALAHVACDDTANPPLPGSSTGNQPGSTGGTNSGTGGTQSGTGASSSTGGTIVDCGQMTGSGNIADRYGILTVTRAGLEYVVQNNVWGTGSAQQTISVNGTSFTVTQQSGDQSCDTCYSPVSYPSIFIGSNNSHTSHNGSLPRQVAALPSIPTSFSHNATGSISGIYNAAYDVWFSTSSAGDQASPSGGYLMVWLYKPLQKNPVGGLVESGQSIAGVDGTWNIYTGTNNTKPVISYVRTQNITSLTFDLKNFINHAAGKYPTYVSPSWYLTNVFGGFEIWSGGVGLQAQCFWVGGLG